MWAIAGSFLAAAFIRAPAGVEAACGVVTVVGALGIAQRAMPDWKGTQRGRIQVVMLATVQSVVIIALAIAFGR
jgi:hypothetical protein